MGMKSEFFENLPNSELGFLARKFEFWILKSETRIIGFLNPKYGFIIVNFCILII